MDNKFVAGDTVRCVDNGGDGSITKGETYAVDAVNYDGTIMVNGNCLCSYPADLFQLISYKGLDFKVGDVREQVEHLVGNEKKYSQVKIIKLTRYGDGYVDVLHEHIGMGCGNSNGGYVTVDDLNRIFAPVKKETVMNIKPRIDAINENTGLKELDDLVEEIREDKPLTLYFKFNTQKILVSLVSYEVYAGGEEFFEYTDQCSKLTALKKALTWLAEKASKMSLAGQERDVKIDGKDCRVKILKEI